MFRVPIINRSTDVSGNAFVPLDGQGMIQTTKFKPNDAFLFSVYLPNGELLITQDDYLSPSHPNPLLQISACFGISRLV